MCYVCPCSHSYKTKSCKCMQNKLDAFSHGMPYLQLPPLLASVAVWVVLPMPSSVEPQSH